MFVPLLLLTGVVILTHLAMAPLDAIALEPEDKPIVASCAQWIDSENGALSLRAYLREPLAGANENIVLFAEIRNNQSKPITILRPFGDAYMAEAVQIKIWNERERIEYSGPKLDYDLTPEAFVTLAAGESVTGIIQLSPRNFPRCAKADVYSLRYDYAYSGDWDKKVASERIKDIWHEAICSHEIRVERR